MDKLTKDKIEIMFSALNNVGIDFVITQFMKQIESKFLLNLTKQQKKDLKNEIKRILNSRR